MRLIIIYINGILIITLALATTCEAPLLDDEYLSDIRKIEPYLESLNNYDGYRKLLKQVSSEQTLQVIQLIESSEYPEFVRAIIEVESGWFVQAHSYRNARGLMQIRPIAAWDIDPDITVDKLFDPVVNVSLGIQLFDDHMEYFFGWNDPEHWALTSYNRGRSGTFALDMHPPSTRYSRKVINHLSQM